MENSIAFNNLRLLSQRPSQPMTPPRAPLKTIPRCWRANIESIGLSSTVLRNSVCKRSFKIIQQQYFKN